MFCFDEVQMTASTAAEFRHDVLLDEDDRPANGSPKTRRAAPPIEPPAAGCYAVSSRGDRV